MVIDNIVKMEDAITVTTVLLSNNYRVTIEKYKPNAKTNAYRYRVIWE